MSYKTAAYHTSRGVPARELNDRCRRTLDRVLGRRRRASSRRPARVARRLLGAHRRRDRRPAGAAAGGPLEPVPDRPGRGAGRAVRHPRQGRHRHRLQRPLLLGHRDLRPAVPHLHDTRVGAQRAAVALADAADAARSRRATAERGRRPLPLAHDQRRGGLGLLRRGHRAVPHRRRRGLRVREVRARDRRPRLHHPRGVDILVETARMWTTSASGGRTASGRALPHPRRHRPGRVHDRRQRQPVHQRDGALQPRATRPETRADRRGPVPRGVRAAGRAASASTRPRSGSGSAPPRRWSIPSRPGHRDPPAGLALPRPRGLGPARTRRRTSCR